MVNGNRLMENLYEIINTNMNAELQNTTMFSGLCFQNIFPFINADL